MLQKSKLFCLIKQSNREKIHEGRYTTMKNNSCVFDPITNTLTITKAFADALSNPSSDEYQLYRQIKMDNPTVAVRKRTHKTSSGYVNQYKKLTYENMEAFIELLPKADELMKVYNYLRASANLCASPYKAVRTWFVEQFPLYNRNPLFYLTADVVVLSPDEYIKEVKDAG